MAAAFLPLWQSFLTCILDDTFRGSCVLECVCVHIFEESLSCPETWRGAKRHFSESGLSPEDHHKQGSTNYILVAEGVGVCGFVRTCQGPLLLVIPITSFSVSNSVTQSCPILCDPMDSSTPGFHVHHQLLELAQTHNHQVSDAIQPSHPLPSPSTPALSPSQHQGLFQFVSSSHQVAKVLEF